MATMSRAIPERDAVDKAPSTVKAVMRPTGMLFRFTPIQNT